MGKLASHLGVPSSDWDYSKPSVCHAFVLVSGMAKTRRRDPDPALPEWIRKSSTYSEGLFDFEDESLENLIALSFYLGEAMRRSAPDVLGWGRERNTALQNQPVVEGFVNGLQLAPLLVTRNVVERFVHARTVAAIRLAAAEPQGMSWALTVELDLGSITVALGEFDVDTTGPRYAADAVVILGDEQLALGYEPTGLPGPAWGERRIS